MGEKPHVERWQAAQGRRLAIGECGVLIAAPRVLSVTTLVLQGADSVTPALPHLLTLPVAVKALVS